MKHAFTRIVLFGSGALLGLIGGALMFAPKSLLETSHVFIERDPGLMSELTAPSGLLLVAGAMMWLGAFRFRFANTALLVGAVVYGTYGAGRLVSMSLHGLPSESLIVATTIEIAIAVLLGALGFVTTSDHVGADLPVQSLQAPI